MATIPEPFKPSFQAQAVATATSGSTWLIGSSCAIAAACASPIPLIAGAAIWGGSKLVSRTIVGGAVLRPALFMEPGRAGYEKLFASTVLGGGWIENNIPFYLKVLSLINLPRAKMAKSALESLLKFEDCFNQLRIGNSRLIQEFLNFLSKLEPGQQTALSLTWGLLLDSGHAFIASIEKEPSGRFTVRIHNGGLGIERHSDRQTTLEIREVQPKNLEAFIWHISDLRGTHLLSTNEQIYDALILLGGDRPETAYSTKSQSGANCSGYSIRCFLQAIFSENEFKIFEKLVIQEGISGLEKGFIEGSFWDKTAEHYAGHKTLLEAKDAENIPAEQKEQKSATPPCLSRCASAVNRFVLFYYFSFTEKLHRKIPDSWKVPSLLPETLSEELLAEPSAFSYLLSNFQKIPNEKRAAVIERIAQTCKGDISMLKKAVDHFQDFPEELRRNEELALFALSKYEDNIDWIPKELFSKPAIFTFILQNQRLLDLRPDLYRQILEGVKGNPENLELAIRGNFYFSTQIPKELFDESLIRTLVKVYPGSSLSRIPAGHITPSLAELIVTNCPGDYLSLPEQFKHDRDLLLLALNHFKEPSGAIELIVNGLSDEQLLNPDILQAVLKYLPNGIWTRVACLRIIKLIQDKDALLELAIQTNAALVDFLPVEILKSKEALIISTWTPAQLSAPVFSFYLSRGHNFDN